MKNRFICVLFILLLVTAGVTQIALGDYINIDNGNIVIKGDAGTTTIDPGGNINTSGQSGSTYIDKNGQVIVNGTEGSTYVDKNGQVIVNGTEGSTYVDKNGQVIVDSKSGGNTYVDADGNVRMNNGQHYVDSKGNVTGTDGNQQNYYVDNKGNVIYTNPDGQYRVNNNVIYTNPDRKYYVDNSGSVTIKEKSGNYSSSPGSPYVDSKGAYYINDIIYSNCDEFPASDYTAYGNQRQGKSGWEFICQGYTFNKPVVISGIVISSIIFRGDSSGEIGIKVFNDKYKMVFQEKNYTKAAGKKLPAGTYYFYPLINSKNTKDCTLRLFLNKKN